MSDTSPNPQRLAELAREATDFGLDFTALTAESARDGIDIETLLERRRAEATDPLAALDRANNALGRHGQSRILRVIRRRTDPIEYRLEGAKGDITLSYKQIFELAEGRAAIAAITGKAPRGLQRGQWPDQIAPDLIEAAEEEHVSAEETQAGSGKTWIREYLDLHPQNRPPDSPADATGRIIERGTDIGDFVTGPAVHPIRLSHCDVYIHGRTMRSALNAHGYDVPRDNAAFGRCMRAAGARPVENVGPKKREYWAIPPHLYRELVGDDSEDDEQ